MNLDLNIGIDQFAVEEAIPDGICDFDIISTTALVNGILTPLDTSSDKFCKFDLSLHGDIIARIIYNPIGVMLQRYGNLLGEEYAISVTIKTYTPRELEEEMGEIF